VLVLTRKAGESIVIPRALIRITVTRVEGNRVRLGVETPHGFEVFREELLEDYQRSSYGSTHKERDHE
jgi:carbon storage regulator